MSRMYNKTIFLKAVEEIDEKIAIEVVSDPNLDGKELSEILSCSLTGVIKDKITGEPMKLSNKVMVAGLLNRLNQLDKENK